MIVRHSTPDIFRASFATRWQIGVVVFALSAGLFWRSVAAQAPAAPATPSAAPVAAPAAVPAASEPVLPSVPTDPAGGGKIPTKNLLQVLRDGGPMMIPIGICSFLLTVFVFERLVVLRRSRVIPGPFVNRFLEQLREGQLDRETALQLCEDNRSPVATVFVGAIKKWGRPSVEVEQAVLDSGERVTNDLRRYLRLFNGISTVSPLLGLLGTVLGMISSFNTISSAGAMGRPDMLAAGIGEALLTTAAGLLVAIPALIIYLLFVSRVDRLTMDIDSLAQQLVELISSDGRAAELAKSQRTAKREKAA